MPSIFSRLKGKDGPTKIKTKKNGGLDHLKDQLPTKPRWEDAFTRKTVEPEEIQELVRRCTVELKARGLDIPFLLLPFRPTSDPSGVRTFVRHFFDPSSNLRGEALAQELRMIEPMVISGVIKWCWARLQGGLVGWDAYELFKVGEQDSDMARDSFKTFIPLSVENESRTAIVFDFFDLLSAVAAHGKANGFGGRKLSRMASWWAFEHGDVGNGFDGSYKAWLKAADATSHLFFAYLRSLSPQQARAGISALPISLQKLVQETEYPPERPSLMMSSTYKVVMIVDTVSPTPFALLRRANHFQYRDEDRMLREYSEYEDPIQALTEECRRVLKSVSAANQTQAVSSSKHSTGLRDASWSRFEDIGFTATLTDDDEDDDSAGQRRQVLGLRSTPASGGNGLARPTTPSWADFLSSGFVDDGPNSPSNLLLPPDKVLPPIDTTVRQRSAQSHRPRLETERNLEPGELASISRFELDDSFWWVWMTSLAPEETPERKSSFGRCAVIETSLRSGRWLVMEEMVKGAAPEPDDGAYIAEKKGFFSWTRRNKGISRSKSTGKHALNKGDAHDQITMGVSKTSIAPDQQAKIQAAAQQLQARQLQERQTAVSDSPTRRGRTDADLMADKTNSVLTLQPVIMSEASPAMKWANKYDKETIRDAYLANTSAGRGMAQTTIHSNGHTAPREADTDERPPPPAKSPSLMPQSPSAIPPSSPMLARDEDHGRASPLPPPKEDQSLELARNATLSPEPDVSPDSKKQQKKLHKEKDKPSGGFRKLFGRKNRQSKLPDHAAADINGMLSQNRKNSMEATTPQDRSAAMTPEPQVMRTEVVVPPSQRSQDLTPRAGTPSTPVRAPAVSSPPARQEPEATYEASVETSSRVDTADAIEARDEFSRFDQGPLDQPAFVPDSDEEADDAVPPPIAREKTHINETVEPAPGLAHNPVSPVSPTNAPALDRWAQIRKNAADRAAQRQSEDQSQGGFSKTTDGDGDTSGEETIESRVARIKARVAELTGNMETNQGPAAPRVPQPLRR